MQNENSNADERNKKTNKDTDSVCELEDNNSKYIYSFQILIKIFIKI